MIKKLGELKKDFIGEGSELESGFLIVFFKDNRGVRRLDFLPRGGKTPADKKNHHDEPNSLHVVTILARTVVVQVRRSLESNLLVLQSSHTGLQ